MGNRLGVLGSALLVASLCGLLACETERGGSPSARTIAEASSGEAADAARETSDGDLDANAALEARQAAIRAAAAKANEEALRRAEALAAEAAAVKRVSEQCTFGSIEIVPSFDPDPLLIRGISGGDREASTLSSGCKGWVSELPNHVLMAPALPVKLRLIVSGESDTTLVVQRPDGSFRCVDNSEGVNPIVTWELPDGATKIWVGGRERGERAVYALGVTTKSNVSAAKVRALSRGREKHRSIHGTIALSPGFHPDPTIIPGITGGEVAASSLSPKCRGWVSPTPAWIVDLGQDFAKLSFHVSSDEETHLVVQRPDGSFTCASKTGEHPAPVAGGELPAGTYKVWVGGSSQGAQAIYRLGLTQSEMSEACRRCKRCELWKLLGGQRPAAI